MAGFLDSIGISKDAYNEASDSTVTEAFEPLPSGAYGATIKEMVLYKQDGKSKDGKEFSSTKLKIVVELTESGRIVSFQNDVSKLLKDDKENPSFMARIKSVCTAANFDANDIKIGDSTKVNSFGKECEGNFLLGVNDKAVVALVKLSVDTNKAEGESYRESNFLEGITHHGAEDIEKFNEKVEKNKGIFNYKGYVKKDKGSNVGGNTAGSSAAKEDLKKIDF